MRLQLIQNNCVRFICGLNKYEHISQSINDLNLLNAYNRRTFLICSFIFDFLITGRPAYIKNVFNIVESKTRNGSNSVTLAVTRVNFTRDEYILSHCASRLWNSLPLSLRLIKIKSKFSNELKEYLMQQQATVE